MEDKDLLKCADEFLHYLNRMPPEELSKELEQRLQVTAEEWVDVFSASVVFTSDCLTHDDFPSAHECSLSTDTLDLGSAA